MRPPNQALNILSAAEPPVSGMTRRSLLMTALSAAGMTTLSAAGMTTLSAADVTSGSKPHSLYHMLDRSFIEQEENVSLVPGLIAKDLHNPLFGEDKPWEARFDNMDACVIFDYEDKLYKLWYSPFIIDERTTSTPPNKRSTQEYITTKPDGREMGVCYATSIDGLAWHKPELGLVEFNGSKRNNLLVRYQWDAGVFKDLHESNPAHRYKMFLKAKQMAVRFSSDGLHWSDLVYCPEINSPGDTQNNAIWVSQLKRYVGITRLFNGKSRVVGRTESEDFINWTPAVPVLEGTSPYDQTYSMPIFPYLGGYLGLVTIFHVESDTVDCELVWSSDTTRWERLFPGVPFIPRGPKGAVDYGCIYPAVAPILNEGEIRIYYLGSNGRHTSWRQGSLCLARLPPDRFVGLTSTDASHGRVRSKLIQCTGSEVIVNANCDGGSLQVTATDDRGRVLGMTDIKGNSAHHRVTWSGRNKLRVTTGQSIRLDFELEQATLYSFRFA